MSKTHYEKKKSITAMNNEKYRECWEEVLLPVRSQCCGLQTVQIYVYRENEMNRDIYLQQEDKGNE